VTGPEHAHGILSVDMKGWLAGCLINLPWAGRGQLFRLDLWEGRKRD